MRSRKNKRENRERTKLELKTFIIKNLDISLHTRFKACAALLNMSMMDFVKECLEFGIKRVEGEFGLKGGEDGKNDEDNEDNEDNVEEHKEHEEHEEHEDHKENEEHNRI